MNHTLLVGLMASSEGEEVVGGRDQTKDAGRDRCG